MKGSSRKRSEHYTSLIRAALVIPASCWGALPSPANEGFQQPERHMVESAVCVTRSVGEVGYCVVVCMAFCKNVMVFCVSQFSVVSNILKMVCLKQCVFPLVLEMSIS